MNKYFIYILLSLFSSLSYADNNTSKTETIISQNEIPKEIQYKLNEDLTNQNYESFYRTISSLKLNEKVIIQYLISKSNDGHIPVYWLLAEYNAKLDNKSDTHKWFYIALISTQQESYLCKDETARNAPRILIKYFNNASNLANKTPQYIEQAMKETSFFLDNLNNRTNPKWICNFGENPVDSTQTPLIEANIWDKVRKQVYFKFIDKFQR